MDLLANLALGFDTALSLQNLLYCFMGVLLGTAVGVLPGLGPLSTIAMLLPMTYALPPVAALIMLAGIYYGAQYGGSITAILVNLPGESSSVVTCLDGYQMARKGRAGAALAIAALGSFFAGTVATLIVAAFATPLTELASSFASVEYVALMVLGLVGAVVLAHGSLLKALAMIVLGLLLGTVGADVNSGTARFAFDVPELMDGFNFVVVAMGLFAFAEIIRNLESVEAGQTVLQKVGSLWPTRAELRAAWPAALRGTFLGSLLGVLPGGGAVMSSFASYSLEKKLAPHPEEFGKGAVAGVAGPESANNAGAQTSFIPLLTLGIPPNPVMALMIGAMTIHSIQPGPQVMTSNPDLFWGLVASMWIGNGMLLVLNLPLIGVWIRMLSLPYRLLYPAILLCCAIGVYGMQNNPVDVLLILPFAVLGYLFHRLGCEPAPLLLGFILGPLLEENLRRALRLSRGDPTVFLTRPVSLVLLLLAAGLLLAVLLPKVQRGREQVFVEED
ncbi:tripartite tricarboxylate transporter permease [Uliginosibacterium sp. 31-16]|uniref:tripartite tricarboxylate transporter permease n=1 Tax=Uliginosibacterium sp. 31-16 TaxID=3068315 RepID=UPI00273DB5AB|nr:tripartite tricarboxylate transporter permease [Uliginosibacterium sp. 31-16]MDP5239076.1 tripartite tricarboxylate transporter permease [Uliginosibacterium sp. 31-16]